MLGLRLRIDAQPRLKNGRQIQTTGVARANWTQPKARWPIQSAKGRPRWAPISSTKIASASGAVIARRRRKSTYSGFGPASAEGVIGSSAMPHLGQSPGWSCTISGCIGQVYCVPAGIGSGAGRSTRYRSGSASNFAWQPAEQK